MHARYHLPKEFYHLVKHKTTQLSSQARCRLNTLVAWHALRDAGWSARRASVKFGVSTTMLYRWWKRINQGHKIISSRDYILYPSIALFARVSKMLDQQNTIFIKL